MPEFGKGVVTGRPYLSPAERVKRGRAARHRAPRSSHGEWEPDSDRRHPVELLEAQSAASLPELVPIRYGRMIESPFRFYRGAASIMAADLASTPRSEMRAQLCGDAHMLNFRLLGSPERRLVFDINDFDETLRGPWEWDVKRLAASLVIAGRENGFDDRERQTVVRSTVRGYREAMRSFAGMGNLDVWYAHGDIERIRELYMDQLDAQRRKNFRRMLAKARGPRQPPGDREADHRASTANRASSPTRPSLYPSPTCSPTSNATRSRCGSGTSSGATAAA